MRAIYILCEGQAEEEFVTSCLRPYLWNYEIYDVRPILMSTSRTAKGGDVKFGRLQHNIQRLLSTEANILVTTFIDFFRLKSDFPGYNDAIAILDKFDRVQKLEANIGQVINNSRFIPYIQLHEFEGLLFSSRTGFEYLPTIPERNLAELCRIVDEYENPELLNDGVQTAPSKRLERLIPGYKKVLYGSMIAQEVSVEVMATKCVRFRSWLTSLVSGFHDAL